MKELEAAVRGIEKDGLVWGASTLVPVGFGIKKLQINLVIEMTPILLHSQNTSFLQLVAVTVAPTSK